MIGRIFDNKQNKTFYDFIHYVLSKGYECEIVSSNDVITTSEETITLSFKMRALANKVVKLNCIHTIIRFSPEEISGTSSANLKFLIDNHLRRINWQDAQYVAVKHNDVYLNPHLHLVVSLIDSGGERLRDSYTKKHTIFSQYALSKKFYNDVCNKLSPNVEDCILKDTIQCTINDATSLSIFKDSLAMELIDIDIQNDDIYYSMDKGRIIRSGSQLGASFTIAGINQLISKNRKIMKRVPQRNRYHQVINPQTLDEIDLNQYPRGK